VPTTEQQVFLANRGSGTTGVVAVYPSDGSTSLDYPVVRVDTPDRAAGVDAAAIEGVVRLLETEGREAALVDGFRAPLAEVVPDPSAPASPEASADPSGEPSEGPSQEPAEDLPLVVPPPSAAEVDTLLAQLEEISRPSRVLAVFDASASMRGVSPSGPTRAQIAQDAAKSSLALFPDTADIGLWFFAVGMGADGADHVEVVPIRSLDPDDADVDQRAELSAGVDTLTSRLTPGGTGLYDTTLAAVRHLRENHDPEASNSVVLVTDGRDEDPNGISRDELVATLQAEADPERPVRVIAIGLSADVDADELTAIAEASGGAAYLAERPEDFQTVLFDALRRR
jgi:Ca-activated chloride channel family protein